MRLIFFLFISMSFLASSQSTEDRVKTIREWYKETEGKIKNCIQLPLTDINDPNYVVGGSYDIIAYYDSASHQIIKIVEETYYDWAVNKTSWYFKKGECFFIFNEFNGAKEMYTAEELEITEEEYWQRGGEAKTVEFNEDRMYYNSEGKCIRYLNKNTVVPASETQPNMKDVSNETLDENDTYCVELKDHGIYILTAARKNQ
ncbi:MAG: hypothetical protein H6582_07830 [Crocinitomicaceae bacterium]|nr:hypothetical protein [Crocinitomicaceae bacterium]